MDADDGRHGNALPRHVRLKDDPGRIGVLTGAVRKRRDVTLVQVLFPDGAHYVPEDQLEPVGVIEDPIDLLRGGRVGHASDL